MALRQKLLLPRFFLYLSLFLLAVEVFFRTLISLSFHTPFFKPSFIICKYYPELKPLLEKPLAKSDGTLNVLILGGSTVSDLFCNTTSKVETMLRDSLRERKVKVYDLAIVAQNSLDARYKMELLKESKFDYVVFYEGINDTRANNCPAAMFDTLYRHIEFYNDINTIMRHSEMNVTVIPFAMEYGWNKMLIALQIKKVIPKEFYMMDESCNCLKKLDQRSEMSFMKYGSDVKTGNTLRQNLHAIYGGTKVMKGKFVLLSYACHFSGDYGLDKFLEKKKEQKNIYMFPDEVWGEPQNVQKAINVHNQIIAQIAGENKQIIWSDFGARLEKSDSNFIDICHLTNVGCDKLCKAIAGAISGDVKAH